MAYRQSHGASYPDFSTHSSAPRAASVTSGRSGTRRHRHARSHHGGASTHTAQNAFPVFAVTGDVDITISNESGRKEKRYVLHRLILSQYSGFFEASTRDAWNGAGEDTRVGNGLPSIGEDATTAHSGSSISSRQQTQSFEQTRKRWRYALDWQNAGDEGVPMLKQETVSSSIFGSGDIGVERSLALRDTRSGSTALEYHVRRGTSNVSSHSSGDKTVTAQVNDPDDELLKDYDNLFRIMYQFAPSLDAVNIATAYSECKALLQLADMYDALEIVGTRVDHHLLRFGARLFKQIAKYPPSYLKLGYLARSRTIFTEALIHVVGQWPLAAPQLKHHIDANVFDLILDKHDDLDEAMARVEGKLWRLCLTTSRGERVTPANDYLSWLAISLFRQWLAENTTPSTASILKDVDARAPQPLRLPGQAPSVRASSQASNYIASQRTPSSSASQPLSTGRIYLMLGSTSQSAYLGHEDLKRFLKLQPELYTRDNLRRFERRMEEVKHIARDIVRPLMRNNLELDLSAFGPAGLGYLTCTRLEEVDLPWDE